MCWRGTLILFIYNNYDGFSSTITWKSWSLFPDSQFFLHGLAYFPVLGDSPVLEGLGPLWIMTYVNLAIIQGPLTLCLHCSELIANVIRDEEHWRCGTGQKGITPAMNPLKSVIANPLCLVLFIAKPVLRKSLAPCFRHVFLNEIINDTDWVFGLCFVFSPIVYSTDANNADGVLIKICMYPMQVRNHYIRQALQHPYVLVQIFNLFIVLILFACFFTLVALRQRRGPQPAAYGHLRTLANLVDEWAPVMWWGHKEDEIPYCHAGRILAR
jgi:hypothetical protein